MDERSADDGPAAIEGADDAALGMTAPPEPAPPGAEVDATERRVPGPTFDQPDRSAKPWASSLAAASDQAGVANDPGDEIADEDAD
jgi:hypothetical protein